jgi:hypothetical protein
MDPCDAKESQRRKKETTLSDLVDRTHLERSDRIVNCNETMIKTFLCRHKLSIALNSSCIQSEGFAAHDPGSSMIVHALPIYAPTRFLLLHIYETSTQVIWREHSTPTQHCTGILDLSIQVVEVPVRYDDVCVTGTTDAAREASLQQVFCIPPSLSHISSLPPYMLALPDILRPKNGKCKTETMLQ